MGGGRFDFLAKSSLAWNA
jgi:hypothetical protein